VVEAVDVFALGRSVNCLALCEPLVYRGQRPRSHTVSSSHGGWGGGGAAHKVGPLASHLSHASMQTLATQASMLAGNDRRRLLFPAVAPSREAAAAERHLRGASRSWLDGASELFASLSMGPAAGKVAFHQTRANLLVATAPAYADACAAHLGWGLPSAAAAAAAVVTHAANASGGLAHAGENCHAACQGVPGSCPGFCGGGGACCMVSVHAGAAGAAPRRLLPRRLASARGPQRLRRLGRGAGATGVLGSSRGRALRSEQGR